MASTFDDFRDPGPGSIRREIGVFVGVAVDLPLGHWVALEPEVAYAQKGTRLEGPAMPGAITSKCRSSSGWA